MTETPDVLLILFRVVEDLGSSLLSSFRSGSGNSMSEMLLLGVVVVAVVIVTTDGNVFAMLERINIRERNSCDTICSIDSYGAIFSFGEILSLVEVLAILLWIRDKVKALSIELCFTVAFDVNHPALFPLELTPFVDVIDFIELANSCSWTIGV